MAQIRSKPFGVTRQGANVTEYILSNPGGLTVSVLDYGCIIKNIIVPAKNGPVDVVLGHDTMADYEDDFTSSGSTCCGAFVGRYANRIENAVFSVGGKTYQLEANNGPNHLHGCFSRKLYRVKAFGDTLLMEAESPDGEDGFPGNLKLAVRYTLTEDNTFRMDYRVSSDADTIVNLTNHSYFNLNGEGDVLGQKLRIYASNYLEGNNQTCPTGAILPVADTPMDFTEGKLIGRDIDTGFAQTTMVGGGYDHCYVIDRARGSSQSICACGRYCPPPSRASSCTPATSCRNVPPPARAACLCRSTAALHWRPSTIPAAPRTRSSPPLCCGRARCSVPPPPCGSSPASSAGSFKE